MRPFPPVLEAIAYGGEKPSRFTYVIQPREFVAEIGGGKGFGRGVAWKSPKADFFTSPGIPAESAGFQLSNSHGDGGPNRHVAQEIQRQAQGATMT
jgi:hypothetical protein